MTSRQADKLSVLVLLLSVLLSLLMATYGPALPCVTYMVTTGDYPGSRACADYLEDSTLVEWTLTARRLAIR